MKKALLGTAVSIALCSSMAQAKVTEATLYPSGGVLTWSEDVLINKGSGMVTLQGLPANLNESSVQAALNTNGNISIQKISFSNEEADQEGSKEYQELQRKRLAVMAALSLTDFKISAEENQINFTTQIASNPGEKITPDGVKEVASNIYEIRVEAFKKLHLLEEKKAELQKEKEKLDRQIDNLVRTAKSTKTVTIEYQSDVSDGGEASVRFQIPSAGWRSEYDVRLDSNTDKVFIENKAVIRQQSGIDWEDVDLSLSTMKPSQGASLPPVRPWDIHRVKPVSQKAEMAFSSGGTNMMRSKALKLASDSVANTVQPGAKTQSFKIKGKVDLESQTGDHVMVVDSHEIDVELKTHFMPYQSDNGYIVAHGKYKGDVSLSPSRVTVFRDGEMLGPWFMPRVNSGEDFEIGFGVDSKVSLEKIVVKDERGTSGVVNKENTWERLNKYEIVNHYNDSVNVRVIERLPVSRHEDINVTHFDVSRPFTNQYENIEGVIAWDRVIDAGGKISLTAGYEIEVPEDQEI